jgi:hypothetical protein
MAWAVSCAACCCVDALTLTSGTECAWAVGPLTLWPSSLLSCQTVSAVLTITFPRILVAFTPTGAFGFVRRS